MRENERRYRALAESTKDIIYILDREGRLVYANRAASERIGISACELVGRRQSDLFPAEVARAHVARIERVFAAGESLEADEVFHFGGEEIWLRVHLIPLRDESGQITAAMGVSHDITARKRAEAALQKAHGELERRVEDRTAELLAANRQLTREVAERNRAEESLKKSEFRFRNYFEHGLIGMAVTSADQRWLEVNDRLCAMLGYSREELMRTTWAALTHADDLEKSLQFFCRLVAGEIEHFSFDKRYIKKDGSILPATIHTRALRGDDGVLDHIVTLVEDLTERRRAEEALRHSEEVLRVAFEEAPVGIVFGVADGILTRVNRAFCEMTGFEESKLLGKSIYDLTYPDDRPLTKSLHQQLYAGSIPSFSMEKRYLKTDGGAFWAQVTAALVRDRAGNSAFGMAYIVDITAQKLAHEAIERERRSLKHMLQASDHERRLIAYDIHDGLAQELAGAIMQFQVYAHARAASIGVGESGDAARLFDTGMSMLQASQLEARRLISGVRPPILDESGVVAAIAHLAYDSVSADGPRISLRNRVTFKRLAPVVENAIYRIVQEGLANARNHSRSKGIRISLTQRRDRLRIAIRDWGIGFDPKEIPGNHFGIEGIRERARLLGGECRIKSKPGKGTLVAVELPVVEPEPENPLG